MPITIRNMGGGNPNDKGGKRDYQVEINGAVICKFTHFRKDGLATCLEKAAKAVSTQEVIKKLSNKTINMQKAKEKYPRIKQFGISPIEAHGMEVVPPAELKRVLNKKQQKQFDELFGAQTYIVEGFYAWDVEAVLERMKSGRLTGTQLDWD